MPLAILTAALVLVVGSRRTGRLLREVARATREARRLEETRRQAKLDEADRRRAGGAAVGGAKKPIGFRP